MAQSTIAADLGEAFYVQLHRAAQVTFGLHILGDVFAQLGHFVVGKVLHTRIRAHTGLRQDLLRSFKAHTVNVGQSVFNTLSRGRSTPSIRAMRLLALSLLVLGIAANHIQFALALNNFAARASFFDGCSYFHLSS